ncbi:MAG: ABC transporter permease [Planctomycetota bacterium]|nr:ABC transporter permease [Planctomycetota bacterium]
MTAYIIRRLIFGTVLIFLSSIVSFTILKLSPGTSVGSDIDPRMSAEYREQQKRLVGLDRHPVRQYLDWFGATPPAGHDRPRGILQGYLGDSIQYRQPVSKLIRSRLPATIALNVAALVVTWLVALPLGIYAAVKQYKWPDKLLSTVSFAGMSLPNFFLALVLLWLFASRWQIIPPGGLRDPIAHEGYSTWGKLLDYAHHLILPVTVLAFGALAELQRITRGNMLETLRMQYVTTARAKGLDERKVIYKHALRNAVNPLITILGFEFAALFGGAALLEMVINYPGMGVLLLEALRSKDQPLILSLFLIASVMLVLGNLLAELLLAMVDPRVSYA